MERSDLLRIGIDLPAGEPVVLAVPVVTVVTADGGRAGSGAQKRVWRT